MNRMFLVAMLVFSLAAAAFGETRTFRLPLHQGRLDIHQLNVALCEELHLPSCPAGGEIDLLSPRGSQFLCAVNACLWRGASLDAVDESVAVLKFERIDHSDTCSSLRRLSRVWMAEQAPASTAAQAANWGLLLPAHIDTSRPLVVLIHGLDSDRSDCAPMGDLLQKSGQQVAYFSYPGDQPIPDSADLLARQLAGLRAKFPGISVDLLAHSMGGLVAREYVEGPDYAGGVDRLIMVAPPNGGSSWARMRTLLSAMENYHLRHDDPNWNWTWLVTEGMGEAGSELLPGSSFLTELNSRPRRAGVKYTIVAGNKSSVDRVAGNCADRLSGCIPARARNWWGVRTCYAKLNRTARSYHEQTGSSDGPVALASTRLAGVTDYVVLPADHVSLYLPVDGNLPLAWPVVKDRLSR